jgi:anti-sigma B factor antagonist
LLGVTEQILLQSAPEMARAHSPYILPLQGEIDLHVSPGIVLSLAGMTAKRPAHIVVDLSGVTYVDSSGLAALIQGMQNVVEYGGKFALAGLQEDVRPIFEIAKLDQVFEIFPDVDSALAAK